MSDGTNAFLHLASGSSAADVIAETLRRLERDESVIGSRDALNEGPIHDVDAGAGSRVEWWSRIRGRDLGADEAHALDDTDLWAQVRSASLPVVLWHGPHPVERIFALRACWHLRDQPERVHEVAIAPSGRPWPSGPRPAFYDAVPITGPNETVKAWEHRAKVADVAARANQWDELRARSGDWIRVLDDEQIVHLPITAYDPALVRECGTGPWSSSLLVVATVLSMTPTGDAFLSWRVREMIRAGILDGRGDANGIGLPEEIRRSAL